MTTSTKANGKSRAVGRIEDVDRSVDLNTVELCSGCVEQWQERVDAADNQPQVLAAA